MKHQTHVGCLVALAVGGNIGSQFQAQVEKFQRTNGTEWTVQRLKGIWTAALHLKNHDGNKARAIYQDLSIAYDHETLVPKGPIGPCVKAFLAATHLSSLKRWSAVLRFYTGLYLTKPSRGQVKKALDDITSSGPVACQELIDKVVSEVKYEVSKNGVPSPSLDSHYIGALKGSTRYYSPHPLPPEGRDVYYGSLTHSLLTTRYFPSVLEERVQGGKQFHSNLTNWYDKYCGKIHMIQEGGAKARVIAIPNAWLQLAFRPLHSILEKMNKSFPESFVHNQLDGVREILGNMRNGKPVISLDLTAATDRLPRSLQVQILREMGLNDYAQGLEEVSSYQWDFPQAGTSVSYQVGQPMGLYGSFPLLNLTNCLLARKACREAGLNMSGPPHFVVLGDDIAFFSLKAANVYRRDMEKLGVTISPTKSFRGNIAQFAGYTIIRNKNGIHTFRPLKHSGEGFVTNPLQFLDALGSKVKSLKRSEYWTGAFDLYRRTAWKRDTSLQPLNPPDERHPRLAKADDRWLMSVGQRLTMSKPHLYDRDQIAFVLLPARHGGYSIQDKARESSFTLIRENQVGEIVGLTSKLTDFEAQQKLERDPHRQVQLDLVRDPLIQEEIEQEYAKLRSDSNYSSPGLVWVQTHYRQTKKAGKTSFLVKGHYRKH